MWLNRNRSLIRRDDVAYRTGSKCCWEKICEHDILPSPTQQSCCHYGGLASIYRGKDFAFIAQPRFFESEQAQAHTFSRSDNLFDASLSHDNSRASFCCPYKYPSFDGRTSAQHYRHIEQSSHPAERLISPPELFDNWSFLAYADTQ